MAMQAPNYNSNFQPDEKIAVDQPKVTWWLRVASSGWDSPQETVEQRESARRSRMTAWILLGILVALVLFIPATLKDTASLFSVLGAAVGVVFILWLNRRGRTTIAGTALTLVATAATISVVIFSKDGLIHLIYLPAFDFMVIPVILGASILPRNLIFPVAILNIAIVYADLFMQAKSQDLLDAVNSYGSYTTGMLIITGRPIAILVITAVIAYLWAMGMEQAVRRADREQELRAVEQQFAEVEGRRTEQVEEFVQETINAINALANGQEGMLLLSSNHPWQGQANFINQQLKHFFRLKQSSRGPSAEQVSLATEMLLRLLQRINADQASVTALDPRQFNTPVPMINEIAKYLYFMLQGKRAPVMQRPSPGSISSGLERG